jgi:hypothetical protein
MQMYRMLSNPAGKMISHYTELTLLPSAYTVPQKKSNDVVTHKHTNWHLRD